MSGAIPLLPLYAITVRTWTNFTFFFFYLYTLALMEYIPYINWDTVVTTCSSLNLYTTCYRLFLGQYVIASTILSSVHTKHFSNEL
jgi:hypothetical protein